MLRSRIHLIAGSLFLQVSTSIASLGTPSGSLSTSVVPLSLTQVLDQATRADPTLQILKEQQEQARAKKSLAIGALLPHFDLVGSAAHKKEAVQSGKAALFDGTPYNQYSFQFQFEQPLFRRGIWSALEAPDLEFQKLEAALENQLRLLQVKVIRNFYRVLFSQRKIESLMQQKTLLQETLQTVRQRERIGRSQRLDVLQVKTEIAVLEPRIEKARSELTTSAAALAFDMGSPRLDSLMIQGSLSKLDENFFQKFQFKDQPSEVAPPPIRMIQFEHELIAFEKQAALSQHWPQAALVGQWGRSALLKTDLLSSFSDSWEIGIELKIPIFSGLSSLATSRQWNSRARESQATESRTRNEIALRQIQDQESFRQLLVTLRSSDAAVQIAADSLKEAKRNYALATIDYQQYLSIQKSYLDAQMLADENRAEVVGVTAEALSNLGISLKPLIHELDGLNSQ